MTVTLYSSGESTGKLVSSLTQTLMQLGMVISMILLIAVPLLIRLIGPTVNLNYSLSFIIYLSEKMCLAYLRVVITWDIYSQ